MGMSMGWNNGSGKANSKRPDPYITVGALLRSFRDQAFLNHGATCEAWSYM